MKPEYAGGMIYADLDMLAEYNMLPNYAGRIEYAG